MHDIRLIREEPQIFDEGMRKRGLPPCAESLSKLDKEIRSLLQDQQAFQARCNEIAKLVPQAKAKGVDISQYIKESEKAKANILKIESELEKKQFNLNQELERLPNIIDDLVPEGVDENGNKLIKEVGKPRQYDFTPLEHYVLGDALGLMDFEQTAKISGSRFVTLKGALARMERALANFMLDIHTRQFGYTEVVPPSLVKAPAVFGVGQLPKFEEDLFKTTDGYYLISTSEVPLTNMVADTIIAEENLPLRLTAYTTCFRSEAGSAGRDTRGMIRQHQFSKVELVSIVTEKDAKAEHERMLNAAEEILKQLELPYRIMLLCSGDTGFQSKKTYDLEVWLPGQNKYREISSCSNCGDFQARRMKARYKEFHGNKNYFVHTLNGSGLAIGRTIVAIMENYQQADGSIEMPQKLKPYMGELDKISRG